MGPQTFVKSILNTQNYSQTHPLWQKTMSDPCPYTSNHASVFTHLPQHGFGPLTVNSQGSLPPEWEGNDQLHLDKRMLQQISIFLHSWSLNLYLIFYVSSLSNIFMHISFSNMTSNLPVSQPWTPQFTLTYICICPLTFDGINIPTTTTTD